MTDATKFYINGAWVAPSTTDSRDIINPATEDSIGQVALGASADIDAAVAAAKAAFPSFAMTSKEERLALLDKIIEGLKSRAGDLAAVITAEMGAPDVLAARAQVPAGIGHFMQARNVLENYEFEEDLGTTHVFKEAVGVCGMITPWNWPLNQIACKVGPAIATGCTMVLKPSEEAPLSAVIVAEVLHEAGVPAGVFNLVHGDGPGAGAPLSSHPDVDMVSFTGSTRGGVAVAQAAAPTVKRVAQELGGKSAWIVLDDADLKKAVGGGAATCFNNTGQSCNAPTRMFVPRAMHDEALAIAAAVADKTVSGDPKAEGTSIGPIAHKGQFGKVKELIDKGIEEGATLAAGGPGLPEGTNKGYFVRPTVFGNVTNEMTIAREEIFGPVLSILPYDDEDEAIAAANDTVYGLSGYVASGDLDRARKVALQMRTGMVHLNGAPTDQTAPFGGYKQSGNGREWGAHGFEDFLETKAIMGYAPKI